MHPTFPVFLTCVVKMFYSVSLFLLQPGKHISSRYILPLPPKRLSKPIHYSWEICWNLRTPLNLLIQDLSTNATIKTK